MKVKNLNDIPKAYDPRDVEDKWYKYWENNKVFHSEVDESKEPYTIVIPPPNVTGMLHLGHILNNTLQDIYIRYKKMMGFNSCWVPGTDHASIATESKVIGFLKEKGVNKFDIGREEFLKHCWEWTEKYGGIILKQLRKLGASCDWDRLRFTMDDHYYKKVVEAFVKLYNEGFIYRGYRMVNWCPASKSAISDEEVFYKTQQGKLWYFRYPVVEGEDHMNSYVVVATTRPETMLGDTAVAVNPNDDRYKNLIGKKILLPICEREIPVIADEYVNMEFGTGVVKVTPAHDINDYEMGKRHNLEVINIFNDDASTNGNVPHEFQGLDRYEVRKKIVARFEGLGLIDKIEDYTNKVGYSQRGDVPIEPYLSEQWFMTMDDLVKPALEAVREGRVKFYPAHWIKTYEHWMENIRDWCISRQLWWGHRIPVWYCSNNNCKDPIVAAEAPNKCPVCGSTDLRQDEDVLDTWASSWLWAQDVFTTEKEQNYYYPTDLLVTAPDIIFFWVARMIIAGMKFMDEIPFRDVYFTSLVRDSQGRKMSKSLGNSPDPIDVINEYGADALRFTITYISPLGQDVLFDTSKCELGRNFANKIWNAGRFLLMNAQDIKLDESLKNKHVDFADEWILSRFQNTIKDMHTALDNFEVNNATKIIYSFVWNDYCDWYLELIKNQIYSEDREVKSAVLTRALLLFEEMLKIVHPFMPFITEEIWQLIGDRKDGDTISNTSFPQYNENLIKKPAEDEIEFVQKVVTAIRNIRGEMNIPPSRKLEVFIKSKPLSSNQIKYISSLAKLENLTAEENVTKPKASASAVVKDADIYIPLEGIIDLGTEKLRLEKEAIRLESLLNGVGKKLSNEKFVNNAPAEVVERERAKQRDWDSSLRKIRLLLEDLA